MSFPPADTLLQKLIKRVVFPEHMALLTKRQDELLSELSAMADEGFDKAEEEWEKSVVAWGKSKSHFEYINF